MIRHWINNKKNSWRSEFAKNMRTLMAGTVLSQLIVVAFTPILSRIFTPEDFTTLEQFTMLLNILVVFITGKYEFAIMHPKQKEDARHLLFLSIVLALIGSCAVTILGLLFSEHIGHYYNNPNFGQIFWVLGPCLFAFAVFNSTSFWFSRQKKYIHSSTSKIVNSTAGEPIKVLLSKSNFGSSGLIIGTTLGQMIGALYSFFQFKKNEPKGFKDIHFSTLKQNAKRYKDYPMISIWGSILNRLAQWAHVGIFAQFYGLVAIGWMALSRRIVQAPLNIISGSFSQVFFQKISEIEDPIELKNKYYSALKQLTALSLGIVSIVYIIPNATIGWIFGEAWLPAINYLRILTIWYAFNFVTSSLSFVSLRIEMQRVAFLLDLLHFVIIYGCIFLAYHLHCNEYEATQILVLSKAAYFTINILVVSLRLNRYVDEQK